MAFGSEIKQGNITENWLFDFQRDEGAGTLYLAFSDTTDSSNFYHGVILNKPSIRESIDLASSTAKSSNISISIPDFSYQGSPISKELFGGSNHYINQTVSVWSKVGAGTKQQIGSFRLTDISSSGDTIQLSLTTHRPWDFISIPQTISGRNVYAPLVYGNFTKNTNSSYSSPQFKATLTSDNYFPCPYHQSRGGHQEFVTGDFNLASTAETAYYDKSFDKFLPLDSPKTSTTARNNVYVARIQNMFYKRGFKHRFNAHDDSSHTAWDDEGDAYDTLAGTYSKYQVTIAASPSNNPRTVQHTNNDIIYSFEVPTGKVSQGELSLSFASQHVVVDNGAGDTVDIDTYIDYTGTGSSWEVVWEQDINDCNVYRTTTVTKTFTDEDSHPSNILIGVKTRIDDDNIITGGELSVTTQIRLIDAVLTIEMLNEEKDGITAYCGADGFINSWDSSAITEIHEAHLDLLIRFAGVKQKDGSAISTPTNDSQVDGYNNLNTSKDWLIRWWQLEPVELKKALEKLQYEGGFIFRFKADGSPQYIHIPDTQTVSNTFTKQDISNVTVRPSPFSELLTKMDISYRKHPAENRYLTSVSSSNGNARTNWNIQTKENVKQVNLDAYVGDSASENDIPASATSNPNDDFYTYYDNIFGDIKMLVSCTIVNPKYYDVEVGDIVAFSDMYPETPFGYNSASWSGLKFMITSLNRTLGELKIEAREI